MTQTHVFQTEAQQLLHLMIHSLYSEREIFLRELISNASDACDKLRFNALTEPDLLSGDEELRVEVDFDAEAQRLTIRDNGIGLTEAEAIEHLGTIAHSGTAAFAEQLAQAEAKEGIDAKSLIGQFGVGFYSAFMVADRIEVESRAAGASSDDGVRWESTGDGNFTTETIARPQRGTTITLHLKDDAKEFADRWKLQGLIKKYSDFVTYPIMLPEPETDGEDDKKKEEQAGELGWEQVNSGQPLWTRPKDEIDDEQYKEFYQQTCKQWDEPATRLHFTVEGALVFTALLFVPSTKPFDLFDRGTRGLSLYVRRVFIMDDCDDLLPEYLRFVKGVVDSDDLPLNVSREMLQQQDMVRKLRKILVKRILDHLQKLAGSDDDTEVQTWQTIDEHFGPVLREGVVNDFENKERIAKLIRYRSTWTEEQERQDDDPPLKTGLTDYVARMPEGQEKIYFVSAASLAAAKASPHLEGYRKKGYEVLFLTDPVDEWVGNQLGEFDGKSFVSVAKGADDLADDEEQKVLEERSKEYEDLLGYAKEALGDGVKEVRLSARLTDSPCCLVAESHGMSNNMEELMRRYGQDVPPQQRILELNPDHELVQHLRRLHADEERREQVADHLQVLRDQSLLAEGARIDDPAAFARRVQQLMASAIG